MPAPLLLAALLSLCAPAFAQTDDESRAAYAGSHAAPLDWKAVVGEYRLVYLGETHPIAAIKDELTAHMMELKEAGITHLALEMVSDDKQGVLDDYCDGSGCPKPLDDVLQTEWGWIPASYAKLVDAAGSAGLRVVAIDLPRAESRGMRDNGATEAEIDRKRDRHMADRLDETLKDPNARVLVLVGAQHLERQPKLVSVVPAVWDFLTGSGPWDRAFSGAGLEGRLMLALPKGHSYDGVVSLPAAVVAGQPLRAGVRH